MWQCVITILLLLLTHQIFVIVIIRVVDNPMSVTLIESTQTANAKSIRIDGGSTLK